MRVIQLPSGDIIIKKGRKLYILVEDLSLREIPFLTRQQVEKINQKLEKQQDEANEANQPKKQ